MVLPVDLPDEKLQKLIAHELTHVFQFEILFGGSFSARYDPNAPQWFMEGMASYFGNDEDAKDRMVLRDAVLSDRVPEIAQRGIYGFFAYRFGHAVFDFIERSGARTACATSSSSTAARSARASSAPSSARSTIPAEDFDIRFRRYLRQKYLKILTEKGEPIDFGDRVPDRRGHSVGRALAARATLGRLRRGDLDLGEDADVVVISTPRAQALQEPDQGLQDRLRVHRRAVADDRAGRQGVDLAVVAGRQHASRSSRAGSAGASSCCSNALDGDIRDMHRDAGPRPAAQPGLLAGRARRSSSARMQGRPGRHLLLRPRHAGRSPT